MKGKTMNVLSIEFITPLSDGWYSRVGHHGVTKITIEETTPAEGCTQLVANVWSGKGLRWKVFLGQNWAVEYGDENADR